MANNQKTVVKVRGIEKSYNFRKILHHIDFDIRKEDRIGLVGYNGSGKTTLAKILFGTLLPEKGNIEMDHDLKIGYLSQSIDYELNQFQQTITSNDGQEFLQYASRAGLQRITNWEENRLQCSSGGEKLKVMLSMIWSSKPDFLILDEPTNHLDFMGVKWLVAELEKFTGPVLIISHDRHFLDQTVNQVFELENTHVHFYNGNYSNYRKQKQEKLEEQQHHYKVQQSKIEAVQQQMNQLTKWSDKAHRTSTKQDRDRGYKEYHRAKAKKRDQQVKSKLKRLEQELEKTRLEKPSEEAKVRFEFDHQGKRGKRIMEAKGLTKTFQSQLLFKDSHFYINHGERVGLLGPNGCGKTTLIKMILDEESISRGDLWKSESLKIAYLSQDVGDLPSEKRVMEALGFSDRQEAFKARTMLANLGLKEQKISQPISTLSLGERTRVKLVEILMKEYDVLILDEPTNHLDLPSREQLERTLNEFTGTIILVSHDFYFLNKLCDKLLVFENQMVRRVESSPEEYFMKEDSKNTDEDLMIIENRIAVILSELSLMDHKDGKYKELDEEFKLLLRKKRSLLG